MTHHNLITLGQCLVSLARQGVKSPLHRVLKFIDAGATVSISRPQLSLPASTTTKTITPPTRIKIDLSKASDMIRQINNTLSDQTDSMDEDQVISQLLQATQSIPKPSLPLTLGFLFNFSDQINQDLENLNNSIQQSLSITPDDLYVPQHPCLSRLIQQIQQKVQSTPFLQQIQDLKSTPYYQRILFFKSLAENQESATPFQLTHLQKEFLAKKFQKLFLDCSKHDSFKPSTSNDPSELPIYNLRCRLYLKGYKFQDSLSNIIRIHETNICSLLPPKSQVPKEFSQYVKHYDFSKYKEPPRPQQPENLLFRQLQNQQMQDLINHRKQRGLQFTFYKDQKN